MRIPLTITLVVLLELLQDPLVPIAAFNPQSNSNFVNYWGQNAASEGNTARNEWQKPLDYYCRDDTEDILVISFLYQFGHQPPAIDLSDSSDACLNRFAGTQLLDCPQMEPDIKYCQSRDKIVLLSLGGATGTYGLSSAAEGRELADTLWDSFGGGDGDARPFGDASVDGFDLDIEAGDTAGYTAFVERMREHYDSDTSKKYYMSAAPQCPYPEQYLSDTLNNAWFDFVWIQFYNNDCGVTSSRFNYDRWDSWARTQSINKNVKLFIGVPASSYAAGRGYVPYQDLTEAISRVRSSYDSFGGVMMWDASAAYANDDRSPSYGQAVARFLHNNSNSTTTSGRNSTMNLMPSAPLPVANSSPAPSSSSSLSNQPTITTTATIVSSVSLLPSTGSTSNSDQYPSPREGAACLDSDNIRCAGEQYAQCVHGQWMFRNCPPSLVCRSSNNDIDDAYCDYPQEQ